MQLVIKLSLILRVFSFYHLVDQNYKTLIARNIRHGQLRSWRKRKFDYISKTGLAIKEKEVHIHVRAWKIRLQVISCCLLQGNFFNLVFSIEKITHW